MGERVAPTIGKLTLLRMRKCKRSRREGFCIGHSPSRPFYTVVTVRVSLALDAENTLLYAAHVRHWRVVEADLDEKEEKEGKRRTPLKPSHQ